MCDRVVFEDPFLVAYCPDKYKTQKECVMKLLMIL